MNIIENREGESNGNFEHLLALRNFIEQRPEAAKFVSGLVQEYARYTEKLPNLLRQFKMKNDDMLNHIVAYLFSNYAIKDADIVAKFEAPIGDARRHMEFIATQLRGWVKLRRDDGRGWALILTEEGFKKC